MKFLTLDQVAERENISVRTVQNHINEGKYAIVELNSKDRLVMDDKCGCNVISFSNLKGGTSKTTSAVHTAVYLAYLGLRVCLIDTDHQNQCQLFFPPVEPQKTLFHVLFEGVPIEEATLTINCRIENTSFDLDFVPSDFSIPMYTDTLKDTSILTEQIQRIKQNYDFIILDSSPNFDIINRAVLLSTSHIIVPIIPVRMHYHGLQHLIEAISEVIGQYKPVFILYTIVEPTAQQKYYQQLISEEFPENLLESAIRKDVFLSRVTDEMTTIYNIRKGKTKGSIDYRKFISELLRRV